MNLAIRKFEEDLVRLYNSSDAPAEAKRFVLLEILHKAEKASMAAIHAEIQELNKQESEVADSE